MGIHLPYNIPLDNVSRYLRETPKMNEEQIEEFIKKAKELVQKNNYDSCPS